MDVFGSHNARYCSGFLERRRQAGADTSLVVVVPLGVTVVEWDVATRTRRTLARSDTGFIVQLTRFSLAGGDTDLVLLCTHHGEVSLWRRQQTGLLERVSNALAVPFDIECAAVSKDGRKLAILGEHHDETTRAVLADVRAATGTQFELSMSGQVLQGRNYVAAYFSPVWGDLALFEQRGKDEVWLHAAQEDDDSDGQPDRYVADAQFEVFVTNEDKTLGIAGCRNRRLIAVDLSTHRIVWTTKVEGHGVFKTLKLKGEWLMCPTDSGRLFLYNIRSIIPVPPSQQLEREDAEGLGEGAAGAGAPIRFELAGPSGMIHSIDWLERAGSEAIVDVFVFNDFGMNHIVTAFPPSASTPLVTKTEIKFHELTCCGIDLRPSDGIVASGDFTGQLLLWKSGSIEPVQRVQVDDMIRSLRFTPSGEHVLLGDVTGRLRFLNLETSTSEMILDMGSTITCIDWTSVNGTTLVAAASTSGQVSLLNNLQPVNGGALSWTAHVPTDGPQDLQFGSIGKYAEVWSLVFAPPQFGCLLATASEDQSVVIWKIGANPVVDTPSAVTTLRGHKAAVTCVSWSDSVFISASDDRTVRVYNPADWSLVCVLSSEGFGLKWHTLTYCALSSATDGATLIVAGSSNGYLLVWSKKDDGAWTLAWVRKCHAGSIEGLASYPQKPLIASCSSDCTVHLTSLV